MFRNGLEDVIGLDWLRMFSHRELQTLISGAEHDIRSVFSPLYLQQCGGTASLIMTAPSQGLPILTAPNPVPVIASLQQIKKIIKINFV